MASSLDQTECPECGQIVHFQPQRWKAQVVCSNCQETFAVEATSAPTANASPEKTPIPSHLSGQQTASESPVKSAANPPSVSQRYKRSKLSGVVIAVILFIVSTVLIGGTFAALALLDSKVKEKNNDRKNDRDDDQEKTEIKYLLAGKKRGMIGDVDVGIKLVEYAPLRVKDQNFKVHDSSEMVVQIYLDIRSRRTSEVKYTSWYGNSFSRGDVDIEATLSDSKGRLCTMPVYEGVSGVMGHTPEATLEKNQRVGDCVIFSLPEGVDITDIDELRLKLPMETVSSVGDLYFKIPQANIKLVAID